MDTADNTMEEAEEALLSESERTASENVEEPSPIVSARSYPVTIAHISSLVAVVLTIWWINLLGGLSWENGHSKQVFNWHPLLMVTAFALGTVAALSFRYRMVYSRSWYKTVHISAWSVTALSASIALFAVFWSHNDPQSGYVANMYSFHSWLGALVGLAFVSQFIAGVVLFALPVTVLPAVLARSKARVMSIHRIVGPVLYVSAAVTILLGIQEKEGFVGCGYKVDSKDTLPYHWDRIPVVCRVSHALGLSIVVATVATCLALSSPVGTGSQFDRGGLAREN